MVYVVGVPTIHTAIGTSAFAVATNAFTNMLSHARLGTIKWRCAGMYSIAGGAGAFLGSILGKIVDGENLLLLFALVMLIVGGLMFKGRHHGGDPDAQCDRRNAGKVLTSGGVTGVFSGFFGIGGGFLIVPGLIASTNMPIVNAIGSSLVAITAFGIITALNYARSDLIDWPLAIVFVTGGIVGAIAGSLIAKHLATRKAALNTFFAIIIFLVAIYMIYHGLRASFL